MEPRELLVVSPVRNEAAHLELVARAMAAQTVRPDIWIVVDDGSKDETPALLHSLAKELPFLRVLSTPAGFTADRGDRHAVGAAPRAFNFGLRTVDLSGFRYIGKLDGDVELPPTYFGSLLAEFELDARLGIAGGVLVERHGPEWQLVGGTREHVRGALKLYTRDCFEAIGGVREQLGWDGLDETVARMKGFTTRSFDHAVARHHRLTGSADGRLRGHVRWGEGHYVLQYGPLWTLLRSFKVASSSPRVLSALAYLYGYLRAAARRSQRVDIDGYRRFVRHEHRRRLRSRLRALPR